MMEIIEYVSGLGFCPYRTYIESIKDKEAKSRVFKAVNKMEIGLFKDIRSLGDGLQEYKIDAGEGHRIYFYRDGQVLVILLAGSTKSEQKKSIPFAKECLKDYKRQKSEGKQKR